MDTNLKYTISIAMSTIWMLHKKLPFCWLLWFYLSGTLGFGQSSISGLVWNAATQEPLAGASILLKSTYTGTFTDESGAFTLKRSTIKEPDILLVSYIGFEGVTLEIGPSSGPLDIALTPLTQEITEVVVEGKKLVSRAFSVEQIGAMDVYLNPNAKGDPILAVQSMPASTTVDETANLSLRGSNLVETSFFFNDVPVRDVVKLDQANGIGQFSIFNTAMLKSINVFPSNPPLEFGGTTAGLIALYTSDKPAQRFTNLALTLVGGGLLAARPLPGKGSITVYGNWSNDFLLKGVNTDALNQIDHFNTIDGGVYWVHHLGGRHRVKFFNYTLSEDYGYRIQTPTYRGVFQQDKLRNLSVLNYSLALDKGRLEFNQGVNWSEAYYGSGNYKQRIDKLDLFSGLQYVYFADIWSIKGGLTYDQQAFQSDALFPTYSYAFGDAYPSTAREDSDQISILEAFGYGNFQWGKDWLLGIGQRVSYPIDEVPAYWSGQLSVGRLLAENSKLLFAVGRYNAYTLPSLELEQKTLIQADQISLDWLWENTIWKWSVAAYGRQSRYATFTNKAFGLEGYVRYKTQALQIEVSASSGRSIIEEQTIAYPSRFDLGYQFRAAVQHKIPNWFDWSLSYRLREGSYFTPLAGSSLDTITQAFEPIWMNPESGERLPMYQLLDFNMSRLFALPNGSLVVFVNANNILNIGNVQGYSYNFNYTTERTNYYGRRVLFIGGIYTW